MKTNRKFLLPIVLSAALALSACGGAETVAGRRLRHRTSV